MSKEIRLRKNRKVKADDVPSWNKKNGAKPDCRSQWEGATLYE